MESIGQLSGGIAHDFNNILAIVLGNLQMAADSPDDKVKLLRRLIRAIKAVNRGSSLTHRLLAFSKKQALDPRAVNIRKTIGDLTELTSRTLGEEIIIKTGVKSDIWTVRVDLNQLENVLLNLALKTFDQ